MKEAKIKTVLLLSLMVIVLDQAIKIYFKADLLVGFHKDFIGGIIGIHYVQTFISLYRLSAMGLLLIYCSIILIRYLKRSDEYNGISKGLVLVIGGCLGRLLDVLTIGSFENMLPFGYRLITMDCIYVNFGFGTNIFSLSYLLGVAGVLIILYAFVTKYSSSRAYFKTASAKALDKK